MNSMSGVGEATSPPDPHEERRRKGRERMRAWRAKNPERSRENERRWAAANPDRVKAKEHRYYEAHQGQERAERVRWERNNPEKLRIQRRRADAKRRDVNQERARQWRVANPERAREKVRHWLAAHPGKQAEYTQNRRAKERAAGGVTTADEWESIKARYGYRCVACFREGLSLTVDHVIPLTRPGASNDKENVQPLCLSCNSKKGQQTTDYRWGTTHSD